MLATSTLALMVAWTALFTFPAMANPQLGTLVYKRVVLPGVFESLYLYDKSA